MNALKKNTKKSTLIGSDTDITIKKQNIHDLSPKMMLDKYPLLKREWTEADLILFHEKGLLLASTKEDESLLISEKSFLNLVLTKNTVLGELKSEIEKMLKK